MAKTISINCLISKKANFILKQFQVKNNLNNKSDALDKFIIEKGGKEIEK